MIETITPQIDKLPKWAQKHIEDCERRCSEAENRLKDYLDSQTPSSIYTRSGLHDKSYVQDDRVSFQLKLGEITVAVKDDYLECHASYRGEQFIIRPWSSNVCHIAIVKSA